MARAEPLGEATAGIENAGCGPTRATCAPQAAALASATGTIERRRYSKSRSSIASRTALTGLPNVADMPAAAPAASSVLRSSADTRSTWPTNEPSAPAGRDDGSLRAEGAAGTDRDRRRERLEERHARRNTALVEENLLHRLWNAVTADGLGAVARHHADDETSEDRNADDEPAQVVVCRAREARRPSPVEGEVRDEADERRQQRATTRPRRARGRWPDR